MHKVVYLTRVLVKYMVVPNDGATALLHIVVGRPESSSRADECHILRQIEALQLTGAVNAGQVLQCAELSLVAMVQIYFRVQDHGLGSRSELFHAWYGTESQIIVTADHNRIVPVLKGLVGAFL